MNILISACLLGVNCKYNGHNNKVESLLEAKVVNKEGIDITPQFELGAIETLRLAKMYNCEYAILKERSPSCGSNQIYDGSFQGKVKQGEGRTASLLRQNGIKVYSEENFKELIK
jgi:uncharacterized protein YbbK (DUF523 family)